MQINLKYIYITFLIFPKCNLNEALTRLLRSLRDLLHCDSHNGFHSHPFIAIVQSDKKESELIIIANEETLLFATKMSVLGIIYLFLIILIYLFIYLLKIFIFLSRSFLFCV